MSRLKLKSLALAVAVGGCTALLSSCGTISDAYDYVSDDSDTSLRTPTGYYEHSDAKEYVDPLKVPSSLATPFTDKTMSVPEVQPSLESRRLVGKNMDVRPPVVNQVSEMGVEIVNSEENAIVWFLPYSQFGVTSENEAWQLLNNALDYLKIPVAESNPARYAIATAPVDYNEFGEPYDAISSELEARRYSQVFKIQVGHSVQGQIGYFITLVSSSSFTGDGSSLSGQLNPRQKASFTVGMGNSLIKALSMQNKSVDALPDQIQVVLGRDNNNQDAIMVNAPYNVTWNVMRGLLEQYGFTLEKYSISRSSFEVSFDEEKPEFYQELGIEPIRLIEGNYIVRLAVVGNNNTVITFYNEKDKALDAIQVASIYSGFSQAFAKEFEIYKREGDNYVAKFAEEE